MLARAPTSLVVLWDFSCSVKSAAAPMARPSTAVIQTFMLLGLKSCPEFVLAGSSTRSHRDYLFICHRSEHGGLLSAGDPTTATHLIWASVLRVQVRGEDARLFYKVVALLKFGVEAHDFWKIYDTVRPPNESSVFWKYRSYFEWSWCSTWQG